MSALDPEVSYDTNSVPSHSNGTIRQTKNPNIIQSVLADDEIVISGIAVRLPESDNMEEFKENLFNKIDMVTVNDKRWPKGIFGIPERNGLMKDLSKFDASFFGVYPKQADVMDPQLRILLELTHECIIDAGVNPVELRGQNIGVYIGSSYSDTGEILFNDSDSSSGYVVTGCHKGMLANRVSFAFDFNGPSVTSDTACSSSLFCLQQAILSLRTGQCDSAIVGGSNCLLKPQLSLGYNRLGVLSPDGKCKTFDESGDGYVRSEGIVCLFLQKASLAKRNYATVIHAKTNTDGYKEAGVTFPSGAMQKKLLLETYKEAGVSPVDVTYVEAHGTGTQAGDPEEVGSIADVFCKDRSGPLKIGTVKSNMGHSEPASGLCGVAKVLIAMEKGMIPPNLHFRNPNPKILSLHDGRLQVVSETTEWKGGFAAVNSFGVGGSNAHVILRSNQKSKNKVNDTNIPTLVLVSGRTEEAVNILLDKADSEHKDPEFIALLIELTKQNIPGHNYRGYITVKGNTKTRQVERLENANPPIWFVFTGMGCQYPGMGKNLLQFEIFSNSISNSAAVLKPLGIDLEELLRDENETSFHDIVLSLVAITCIQIALIDLLSSIGIYPDGYLGHSLGEIACAYIDETLTAEQAVLVSYWRGKAIQEANINNYLMISIGLGFEEAKTRVPEDIEIACHNSPDNVTIAGPVESVKTFSESMKAENIFVREIVTSGGAFHSSYMAPVGPILTEALQKIIPNPKHRSSKWISSSVPEEQWDTPLSKYSSVEYQVNNLLSPVLFVEALSKIPENAVVLEIAPHCLLQALLKRSLPSCINIGLLKRGNPDNAEYLLQSIGKIYITGGSPNVAKLYPKVKFPVSKGTPMIAPHIKWDHSSTWTVADIRKYSGNNGGENIIEVNVNDEQDEYYAGHAIDGRVIFPATGYLCLVWKTFAKKFNKIHEELAVVFENMTFHRATLLPEEGIIKFHVNILEGTGDFEIFESGSVAVSGRIRTTENIETEFLSNLDTKPTNTVTLPLTRKDIYKELRLRGYEYNDVFQGITEADNYGVTGKLKWDNNWIIFLDSMLQFSILSNDHKALYLPVSLEKVVIDPKKHLEAILNTRGISELLVIKNKFINSVKSGCVEIRGLKIKLASRKLHERNVTMEQYKYMKYNESSCANEEIAIRVLVDTAIENSNSQKVEVLEIYDESNVETVASKVMDMIEGQPMLHVHYTVASKSIECVPNRTVLEEKGVTFIETDFSSSMINSKYHIIIVTKSSINSESALSITSSLKTGGFVLLRETVKPDGNVFEKEGLELVASQVTSKKTLLLYKKIEIISDSYRVIKVTYKDFSWVEEVKSALAESSQNGTRILVLAEKDSISGIQGFVNCLKQEQGGNKLRSIFIMDKSFPLFSLDDEVYKKQLKKDLLNNVAKNGTWGSFRHLPLNLNQNCSTIMTEHAHVDTQTIGDLSSLKWIESDLKYYSPVRYPGKELCRVYFASLNFRDIMLATGKLSADSFPGRLVKTDCIFGLEFSGINESGKRVMGVVPGKGLATTVLADTEFIWEVPESWSLKEAATIPMVYSTAYYALIMRGRMRSCESVLIHSGSGGVGQAAISIALHMGCTVYTTVGSTDKKEFLKKRFPQLKDINFSSSRDLSFEQHIMLATEGKGVDIILNSLSEELFQASVQCLARHGRFLEIGKYDMAKNSSLGMASFLKNITFHGVHVDALFDGNIDEKQELVKLVTDGIIKGVVTPLPATIFSENQIEEAFRFMAAGKHIGKIVFQIRDEKENPKSKRIQAIPKTYLDPEKVYIIIGGLGGFGLELTKWMVDRGATRMVLVSRSGISNGYQDFCLRQWRDNGIIVVVSKNDVTKLEGAKKLIKESETLGVIGGIFNLAAVLRDGFMENQTIQNFHEVCCPKVAVTLNLDEASRDLCPELEYFVVFSSISCGRGNAGQANYGFANNIMERIVEKRKTHGYPGLAIQFGAIGDIGLVQETMGGNDIVVAGTIPQRIISCLETLDLLLRQQCPVVACHVIPEKHNSTNKSGNGVNIVDAVANVLGVKDIKAVDQNRTLGELGMDSLMGVELKQMLERKYELVISMQEIRSLTFRKLQNIRNDTKIEVTELKENRGVIEYDLYNFLNEIFGIDGINLLNDSLPQEKCIVSLSVPDKQYINNAPVFLVHPMEGVTKALETLASKLKAPVYGIQCVKGTPTESVEEHAKYYIKQMTSVCPKGPYYVGGYSYGALIAYEMVTQLQELDHNLVKCLILLDGSVSYVSYLAQKHYKKYKSTANMTSSLTYVNNNKNELKGKLVDPLIDKDFNATSFEILSDKHTSLPQTETHIDATSDFFLKVKAACNYNPTTKVNVKTVLIKAKNNTIANLLPEDYGIQQFCALPVIVHDVNGNHTTFLQEENVMAVANIINEVVN